jgi:hypothetical protein
MLEDEKDALMAVYDPRLTMLLIRECTPIIDAIVQPMVSWDFWEYDLNFVSVPGADNTEPLPPNSQLMAFTKADEMRIVAASRGGYILWQIKDLYEDREEPFPLADDLPHLQRQMVNELLAQAITLGLTEQDAQFVYCKVGVTRHFQPFLLPCLAPVRANPRNANDAFLQVERELDGEWDERTTRLGLGTLRLRRQQFSQMLLANELA